MEWFAILTPWHWLTAAVLLIVVEMMVGGAFFLLWVGFAAAATALIQWILGIGWQLQIMVFCFLSVISIIAWHLYKKSNPDVDPLPNLNKRGQQHVGRTFNLSHAIVNGVGKINVNDSMWKVEGDEDLLKGEKVKVVDIQGSTLIVTKI